MNELAEHYNDRLIRIYGRDSITGLPKYRVVWGPSQTEKRYGSYDILTQETGIWLGVKQGLVEIKKYWYLQDCWILERVEFSTRTETFYDPFTYEPILTFLDKDNHPLPLNWRAIEFLVSRVERVSRKIFSSDSEFKEQEEKELQVESERVYAELDKPEPRPLPSFITSTLIPKR